MSTKYHLVVAALFVALSAQPVLAQELAPTIPPADQANPSSATQTNSSAESSSQSVLDGGAALAPQTTDGAAPSANGPAQRKGADSSHTALEAVVVTARRRVERGQDVPIAVTAFTQEDIRQKNIQNGTDLQNFVPSLSVTGLTSQNNESFAIRGLGATGGLTGGGPGGGNGVVAYLVEAPSTASGPGIFFDLKSLQVLNGPQGTLFGRNTTGGAVLMEPERPSDDVNGYVEATIGDYNRQEFRAAGGAPIIPGVLSVRLAGEFVSREGYTKDVVTGEDYNNRENRSMRLGVLFRPFNGFENYLLTQYVSYNEHGPANILVAVDPTKAAALEPYLLQQQALGPRKTAHSSGSLELSKDLAVVDNARWDLAPWLAVKNIFSYSHSQANGTFDGDGTPIVYLDLTGADPGGFSNDLETLTEELQFQGKAWHDYLTWQGGAYFEYVHNPGPQTFNTEIGYFLPGTVFTSHQDFRDHQSRSRAGYGQATLDLGAFSDTLKGLNFTAGYRYTRDYIFEDVSLEVISPQLPAFDRVCLSGPNQLVGHFPDCTQSGSSNSSGPSWTLGLDYHLNPTTMVYVRSSQGYKSGGFNGVDKSNPYYAYGPEKARDVEGGIKSDFKLAGMRMRTDFNLFHTDYYNVQRNTYAVVNGLTYQVTANAASATIQGVELAATIIPIDPVQVSLTYSYNDAFYNKYVTPAGQDLTGSKFEFTPRHKISLIPRYQLPIDKALGKLTASAILSYQSKVAAAPDAEPFDTIAAYGLLNLRLDWANIARNSWSNWDLALFATNVTDTTYRVTSNPTYASSGFVTTIYGEPRMVGASLRTRF